MAERERSTGQKQVRTGIDTGGTFTDFVWLKDGHLRIHKQLSSREDPARSVLDGVAHLDVPASAAVVHGSTAATNALLERRGAKTALITTAGFADVLAIGRQNRPALYALVPQKPPPLVPRRWRFEVQERVTERGEILKPLDADELRPILQRMEADGVQSVAVCLLFSFLRPEHEQSIRDWLQEHAQGERSLHVSLSSVILPEFREYERTSTVVINAYVAPLMSGYLRRVARGVAPRTLTVMQSNGGVVGADEAGEQAARTVLSGPAGGVVGARYVAEQAGFSHVISFDMGGTSTDVALCPGRLPTTSNGEIAGMPLRLPMMDIHTVGAGGGSLATIDPGGALSVGPQSAGADPGPICYGKAAGTWAVEEEVAPFLLPGDELYVTTTDANLVLGRLDADHFLGGAMPLDEGRARAALAALAQQMEAASPEAAAWDVLRVSRATMERAMRRISVERGHDPRRFTLVAFGGAGPLHACDLARSLQIPRVLIPPVPGVLSALGMLAAPLARDYSQTIMREIEAQEAQLKETLQERFAPLEKRAMAEMAEQGYEQGQTRFRRRLDVRYVGQSHELTIPYGEEDGAASLMRRFHEAHERRYGYRRDGARVEIVTVRLEITAPVEAPTLPRQAPGSPDPSGALLGEKAVWFGGRSLPTRLYARDELRAGHEIKGPAVVFQYDTTTVIAPDWQASVDAYGNLILSV